MDIEGTYTLQASPEEVWRCLMDTQVLRRAIPGVEELERLEDYKHTITLHIRQAPLVGSYHGQVTVTEQHYPYYYTLDVEGEGRQSTISGKGVVHLSGRGENTVVAYKGTLNLGKLGTLLPPPLLKGIAKLLLEQFFTALAEHLRTLRPPVKSMAEDVQVPSTSQQADEHSVVLPPVAQRTFLHTVVHWLRLGGGDPTLEERWVQRMRRIGMISGLLFLVWIGTQLPRRPHP